MEGPTRLLLPAHQFSKNLNIIEVFDWEFLNIFDTSETIQKLSNEEFYPFLKSNCIGHSL